MVSTSGPENIAHGAYRVRSFVMVSTSGPENIAHGRNVQTQAYKSI